MSREQVLESLLHDLYDAINESEEVQYPPYIQALLHEVEEVLELVDSDGDDGVESITFENGRDDDYANFGDYD